MKKHKSLFVILILLFILTACNKNTNVSQSISTNSKDNQLVATISQAADKLEVYYFHRTQRCISCMRIGDYTNKTILEYFSEEMGNGKIDYKEINIDLPENKELARKFEATGSSLFINSINGEDENIQNIIEVWNWKSNEEVFKNNLKQKIDQLLGK